MNVVDIILGIFLLLGLLRGFYNGFLSELAGLIALIAGIYGAIYFSDSTLRFLEIFIDWDVKYLALIAFALTFILIAVAVTLIGSFLTKMLNLLALGLINRFLGGIFGIIKMAFICSLFFMFLNQSKTQIIGEETKETSALYGPVEKIAPILLPRVLTILKEGEVFDNVKEEEK